MFSVQHIIWVVISIILIIVNVILMARKKPALKDVLTVCCIICAASEVIKVLSCIEMVPSSDGSIIYPYLQMQHLPLHLCSIQLFTIFYCRFGKGTIAESKFKRFLLTFMYPTCTVGAVFAIALPSIFDTTITASQAFIHPIAYQLFIYHSMLITLGLYIPMSGEVRFSWSTYRSTMVTLSFLSLVGIYINSMMASPTYVDGKLVSVDYVTNFFFLYRTPIGVALNTKLAWFVYLLILIALAFGLIALMYLPLRRMAIWDKRTGRPEQLSNQ
ncbi:MAG: YwaF family protein [Spirochaetales bacterium]|nr:YwaF family protein [Spirochaetales bacterium]